jgi:hypothetical protein
MQTARNTRTATRKQVEIVAERRTQVANPLLSAALDYARRGWPVIALLPRAKEPLTKHGVKDATTDPEIIRSWWRRYPSANIGIATGAASGVFVVDIDGKQGGETIDAIEHEYGPLPHTVSQLTGRGMHWLFHRNGVAIPNSAGRLGPGVDIKGDAGYIVVPPSVHPSGKRYEWEPEHAPDEIDIADPPEWLLHKITNGARPASEARPAPDVREAIVEGQRNQTLTSLAGKLRRTGLGEAAIAAALLAVNDAQCDPPLDRREVEAIAESVSKYTPKEAAETAIIDLLCLSDISAEAVDWLWPGRIAKGKVTLLVGHPGLGKSQAALDFAAIVTTGARWPGSDTHAERGSVLILSAEDDAADTIKPRLLAAKAMMKRCFIIEAVRVTNGDGQERRRAFSLLDDLARLDKLLEEHNDIRLAIIDPLSAYLGAIDSHRNAEVRAALAPLADLAARRGVAVVAISHLRKNMDGDAILRVSGSLAFVAAARGAYLITKSKDDDRLRLLLPLKNNLAADTSGLSFRIEPVTLPSGIDTCRIRWDDAVVEVTADEALAQNERKAEPKRGRAVAFLHNILAKDALEVDEIRKEADAAGLAWATIRRAADDIGIVATKFGFGVAGGWKWELADDLAEEGDS